MLVTTASASLRFNNEDNINVLNITFPTVCIIKAGHTALCNKLHIHNALKSSYYPLLV